MNSSHTAQTGLLRRFLDRLYLLGGNLAALCVLAILVLMIAASVGRVFEWRVSWVNDIVAWLCAAAAFLGMAYSFRNGDFVRVTLVLESVSAPVRRWLELISLSVATVAIGYLGYWAARFTWESYEFNDIAGNMVAIHNVVAASATVGLLGREGAILRKTFWPTVYYVLTAGTIAMIAIYVLGVTDPLVAAG